MYMKELFVGIVLIILIGIGSYFYQAVKQTPEHTIPEGVACTMDAKICPDGSAVGRIPPSCAFAPCPGE